MVSIWLVYGQLMDNLWICLVVEPYPISIFHLAYCAQVALGSLACEKEKQKDGQKLNGHDNQVGSHRPERTYPWKMVPVRLGCLETPGSLEIASQTGT